MAVAALNLIEPGAGPRFFLEFTRDDGTQHREPLAACVTERFEDVLPVRPFYWAKNSLHFPHAPDPRTSAEAEAGLLGHWLAAEIIRGGKTWHPTNPARTGVNRLRLAAGGRFNNAMSTCPFTGPGFLRLLSADGVLAVVSL
jgi:hypothetical protein